MVRRIDKLNFIKVESMCSALKLRASTENKQNSWFQSLNDISFYSMKDTLCPKLAKYDCWRCSSVDRMPVWYTWALDSSPSTSIIKSNKRQYMNVPWTHDRVNSVLVTKQTQCKPWGDATPPKKVKPWGMTTPSIIKDIAIGTVRHCWWGCIIVQTFWNQDPWYSFQFCVK